MLNSNARSYLFTSVLLTLALSNALPIAAWDQAAAAEDSQSIEPYQTRQVSGWRLHVHRQLLDAKKLPATQQALKLLAAQLDEIIRVVPPAAVEQLQQVTLWFSPEYPGINPRAEYHPSGDWLRANGRDPAMARGVEFTNIRIFAAETRRMPNFALHELAHAYHHRVLADGFANASLRTAFEAAKASGGYDRVQRQDSEGNKRFGRAYALTNPQEYFAETTEAYFTRNDFFPFDRQELEQLDPNAVQLLIELWGVSPEPK